MSRDLDTTCCIVARDTTRGHSMKLITVITACLVACGETTDPVPVEADDASAESTSPEATPGPAADISTADGSDVGDAAEELPDAGEPTDDTGEHPDVGSAPLSPAVRRLSVDTLARSLPRVMGDDAQGQPITWRMQSVAGGIEALSEDGLAATLGKADYIQTTVEDRTVSALYVKFMDDMARDVCERRLVADAIVDSPVLVVEGDDATIRAHLRTLLLRFHGDRRDPTDPVDDLNAVYTAAGTGVDGWRAVCVALLTSPAFHLY